MSRTTRKSETIEWIFQLCDGDEDLQDVLVQAWTAGQNARRAVRERGKEAPRTCVDELKGAEAILDAIRSGAVPRRKVAAKAAQAVKRFEMARDAADVDALLEHVVQIGRVPGPRDVVFVAKGAMPFVADWDWLRVALARVLGLALPASVVREVQKVLRGSRGQLPIIARTRGGLRVRAIDLVRSAPPPARAPRAGPARRRIRLEVLRERGKTGVTYGVTSPDAPRVFAVGKTRAIAVRRFHEAAAHLRAYEREQAPGRSSSRRPPGAVGRTRGK